MKKIKITGLAILFLCMDFAHALGPAGNGTVVECHFGNGDYWSVTTGNETLVDTLISLCDQEGGLSSWWEVQL